MTILRLSFLLGMIALILICTPQLASSETHSDANATVFPCPVVGQVTQ